MASPALARSQRRGGPPLLFATNRPVGGRVTSAAGTAAIGRHGHSPGWSRSAAGAEAASLPSRPSAVGSQRREGMAAAPHYLRSAPAQARRRSDARSPAPYRSRGKSPSEQRARDASS